MTAILLASAGALSALAARITWPEWRYRVKNRRGIEHLTSYPWIDLFKSVGSLVLTFILYTGAVLWT